MNPIVRDGVNTTPPKDKACSQKRGNVANVRSSRQGDKKLQFLNDFIKSRHGFKTAQKFHKFRVSVSRPCLKVVQVNIIEIFDVEVFLSDSATLFDEGTGIQNK